MKNHKRYTFWRVFWVVLSMYIFFMLLGIIVMSVLPATNKSFNWEHLCDWKNILSSCISILFSTTFYYFTVNEYYHLISERKASSAFVKPTALAILSLGAYYLLTYRFLLRKNIDITIHGNKIDEQMNMSMLILSFIISALFYLGVSLIAAYLTNLRDEKNHRKILEEQKMQLEVEKSQANFNFLKAQINPHFLHNTLNFLYAKSLPYSAELSEGILTLSDIMRYALSEGNTKDGRTLLKDEIEHVRNVIKINQLRFSNNLNVQFEVEGVINGATIIPFVLITLVENAFKHGDLKSNENPIVIQLKVDNNQLYFYCRNRKKTGPKELSTGIGLENIKKRLDLAYGNQHHLTIKDGAEIYTTELTIAQL